MLCDEDLSVDEISVIGQLSMCPVRDQERDCDNATVRGTVNVINE